jgi:Tfp pilus assembly protein PilZ
MNGSEKRKFKRLPITLGLSCRKVGSTTEKLYKGYTINVGPGGLYFETADDVFEIGNLLKVELSIPPTAGLLEFGGKISAFAKVLRTSNLSDILSSNKYGVALQFCQSPKLCT